MGGGGGYSRVEGGSVANVRHLTHYNPNLDIINVNVHTKFG